MIDHVWTVICSRAVIDKSSNNVSIQNVIEQVNIRGKPEPDGFVFMPLEAVTFWARADPDKPSRARTRLAFWSPSGKQLGSFEREIDLSQFERLRSVFRFKGLPTSEEGRHFFRMEIQNEGESKWQQVAAVPLQVFFVPPETEQVEGESE